MWANMVSEQELQKQKEAQELVKKMTEEQEDGSQVTTYGVSPTLPMLSEEARIMSEESWIQEVTSTNSLMKPGILHPTQVSGSTELA